MNANDNDNATSAGTVRRVVTGHNAAGKAVIVADGAAPNVLRPAHRPGTVINTIWAIEEMPAALGAFRETVDRPIAMDPPLRGCSFRINEYPPEASWIGTLDPAPTPAGAPPRHPLMHRTRSIDFAIVLSGEITMVLDETETVLRAGDVVIQCATDHAWANRSDKPCRMAFVMLGAEPDWR